MAPSVPATGCTVVVDRDRSHKRDGPSPEATKTICRPSGDSAKDAGLSVPGVEISRRVSAGVGGGVSRRCRSAGTASAAAATTDAVATSHGARPRAGADDTPVVVALSTADGAAMASSISSRASAASASRRLRSFSRHRRRSVRIAAGVFTGSAVQSGSQGAHDYTGKAAVTKRFLVNASHWSTARTACLAQCAAGSRASARSHRRAS